MTATTTIRPTDLPAPVAIDTDAVASAEQDILNAAAIMRTAVATLTEAYALPEGQTPDYDLAKHRFVVGNRVNDTLALATEAVTEVLETSASVILAPHSDRDNIDIEGETWHRYDEYRANSVSWKDLATKARTYLNSREQGVITRMENKMKQGGKTYLRLKPGVAKAKKD